MATNKINIKRDELKECPYQEKCYRKNPIHFQEFRHKHLDTIYDNGLDPIQNAYNIPKEYSKNLIQIQLKLLEKLFPKPKLENIPNENLKKSNENTKNDTLNVDKSAEKDNLKRSNSPVASTSAATLSITLRNGNSCKTKSVKEDNSRLSKKPKITKDIKKYIPVVLEKGKMAAKLERAAPYNFFLTAITDCKPTHSEPLTVTLQEILDESLGEIESSVQINFMVDIGWLLGHYYFAGILSKPLLVLYGDEMEELKTISQHQPQVTAVKIDMPTPFATSHAKIMIFSYTDGSIRIVISTANMYEDDWHNRTQGVWISPRCEQLPDVADTTAGESPTNFKQDFLLYLVQYKTAKLQPWIAKLRKCDFGAINVFFIGSVPGGFRDGPRGPPWGHARVGHLLQKHITTTIDAKIPIVCQSSSIGSLGANVQAWIQHDFLNNLRKNAQLGGLQQIPQFKMIYPSYGNVNSSHDGLIGGGCLPYSENTNNKQPWLRTHLHQWCSTLRHRSQAMPHIKSYTRFNLEDQSIYWFLLTSANLSKAAWGSFNKNVNIQPCLRIANYEAGVLFVPKFVSGEDTFPLGVVRDGIPPFPLPYDVPLTPYEPDDKPFLIDYLSC